MVRNHLAKFSVLVLLCVGIIIFRLIAGYYPIPHIFKRVYYSIRYDSSVNLKLTAFEHFKFEKGYKDEYALDNLLDTPYYLYFSFENPIPAGYTFTGTVCITIISGEHTLAAFKTTDVKLDTSSVDLKSSAINGFYAGKLAFPIAARKYKNLKLRISVLENDIELAKYNREVKVYLVPDIDVDTGAPAFVPMIK